MDIDKVKEHFKNAKTVRCLEDDEIYDIESGNFVAHRECRWVYFILRPEYNGILYVSVYEDGEFAEITSHKDRGTKKDSSETSQFKKVTNSLAELLEYKNKKYGDSALNPMNIFQGKTKVGQRVDDKLARVKNSETLAKNDIADLIGYLTLICVENGWDNFDEFKD
jgi:hypothetical protein